MLANIRFHLSSHPQRSQHFRRMLLLFMTVVVLGGLFAFNALQTSARRDPIRLIIDADTGVDDAAAISWLLSQNKFPVDVVGITTVAGNTSVENAASNVMLILNTLNITDIPVVIGASQPLSQTMPTTGAFSHGPDGLWFVGWANPQDISNLPTDAPAFLCSNAATDVKLVALGPLTNIAQAIEMCPQQIALYDEIIILGGAKRVGNISPIAEFNVWVDPEAADIVFRAGLMPRFIPQDTFDSFTITQTNINTLASNGTPLGQLLAAALQPYMDMQVGLGGATAASVPDITAVMVAVNDTIFLKEEMSVLIKMVPGIVGEPDPYRLVRGQTIIGTNTAEKTPMIVNDYYLSDLATRAFTEPGFDLEAEIMTILMSEPDNAIMITDVREQTMRNLFMQALTN